MTSGRADLSKQVDFYGDEFGFEDSGNFLAMIDYCRLQSVDDELAGVQTLLTIGVLIEIKDVNDVAGWSECFLLGLMQSYHASLEQIHIVPIGLSPSNGRVLHLCLVGILSVVGTTLFVSCVKLSGSFCTCRVILGVFHNCELVCSPNGPRSVYIAQWASMHVGPSFDKHLDL